MLMKRKQMESQENFADLIRKDPIRKVKKKRSTISIEEIPDEDATPNFERLPEGERSILIAVNELPNTYEEMPALVPDLEDEEEDLIEEEDLLVEHLQGDENTITNEGVRIRAKTSISQNLTHNAEKKKEKTFEELVPEEFHQFRSVFEKKASERFPESRPWDHAIELKDSFVPKKGNTYPLGLKEEQEMNKFIDENLEKGFIRKSSSLQASPFFFVAKKDSDALRPCQDYRYLNEHTVKNAYPLPSIDDLLNKLKGAQIFTKLDIRWGYNNIRIRDGDQWKGAFITKRGLFEPTVMFFGMTNSPATFQAMMNDYFADYIAQGWILIYLDDILILSKDPKEHIERTIMTLQRIKDKDLFLKPEKCVFNTKEVEYLGFIIKPNEISMDPVKLAGIRDWTPPTNVKGVKSFLGFGNFY